MKKPQKPTDSPPILSCGKLEIDILRYMAGLGKNEWFNKHKFSQENKTARSTVYGALQTLKAKGLINYIPGSETSITAKGYAFLEGKNLYRTVSRPGEEVSRIRDHRFVFEVPIKKYPVTWKHNMVTKITDSYVQTSIQHFSKNNDIAKIRAEQDVDIFITTTKALIKPKNIFCQDHTEAAAEAIQRAFNSIELLQKLGFVLTDSYNRLLLVQKEGHYAEVNSLLAQFFEKHAKGFFVKNSEGNTLFWVDHSKGHLEDETSTEEARNNLNNFMLSVAEGSITSDDLKKKMDDTTFMMEYLKQLTIITQSHERQLDLHYKMLTRQYLPSNDMQQSPAEYMG